ncbi:MAG TPA: hypothetical protein VFL99_13680 [Segeticoccus sp.]|uniref:hypothetical protein n=1 Tax=Segeticoccus sp. TaxID=2706531 RepID=UPI002D808193|nr:hypothetical protein [Segeticoccus sp.]HET8601373.1 hypothetical protein [Segeticoccus sp.]
MKHASREAVTAVVTLVILVFYSATIGWRGVLLIADGRWQAVLLGIGVVLIPIVVCLAVWRLIVFARDGERMMQRMRSGAEPEARDEEWRQYLVEAEWHRLQRDRSGEQAAYRQAVRAWRRSRHAS